MFSPLIMILFTIYLLKTLILSHFNEQELIKEWKSFQLLIVECRCSIHGENFFEILYLIWTVYILDIFIRKTFDEKCEKFFSGYVHTFLQFNRKIEMVWEVQKRIIHLLPFLDNRRRIQKNSSALSSQWPHWNYAS
jgi:hypothetical protein